MKKFDIYYTCLESYNLPGILDGYAYKLENCYAGIEELCTATDNAIDMYDNYAYSTEGLGDVISKAYTALKNVLKFIINKIKEFVSKVFKFLKALMEKIKNLFKKNNDAKNIDIDSFEGKLKELDDWLSTETVSIIPHAEFAKVISGASKFFDNVIGVVSSDQALTDFLENKYVKTNSTAFERLHEITSNIGLSDMPDGVVKYLTTREEHFAEERPIKEALKDILEKIGIYNPLSIKEDQIPTIYKNMVSVLETEDKFIKQTYEPILTKLVSIEGKISKDIVPAGGIAGMLGGKKIEYFNHAARDISSITSYLGTIILKNGASYIGTYNKIVTKFEKYFTPSKNKYRLDPISPEQVKAALSRIQPVINNKIDGIIPVYAVDDLAAALVNDKAFFAEFYMIAPTINTFNAMILETPFIGTVIFVTKPLLEILPHDLIEPVLYHELGHMQKFHVINKLLLQYKVGANEGKYGKVIDTARILFKARPIQHEIEADLRTYEEFGMDTVLKMLNTLKNIVKQLNAGSGVAGAIVGMLSVQDINKRIAYFEKFKKTGVKPKLEK